MSSGDHSLSRRRLLAAAAAAGLGQPLSAIAQRLVDFEVVHWWTGGSESDAIRSLRRRFEASGHVWGDTGVQGPDLAKTAAITRVLGGKPPGAMLWHVGPDLPDLVRDGVIRDVQAVAAADDWDRLLPAVIADRIKVDGKYVVAPIDLHGGNWMFANTKLLNRANASIPTTWPEVLTCCAKLREAGVIPIAFAGQAWQEALVFVQILAGIGGADASSRFTAVHDPAIADTPEMLATFETFGSLKVFVDKASPNRSSTDTANMISTEKAALYFSGDWSRGELNRAGMREGAEYTCHLAPGTEKLFLAVVDAFCMPRLVDRRTAEVQDGFARLVMSLGAQAEFNLIKGSIPLRNDVDLTTYDSCSKLAASLTRGGGEVVPSASMGMTTALRSDFYDVVHRFWNTDRASPKAAARELRIVLERHRT